MNPTDILQIIVIETSLGELLVSHEELDAAGGLQSWLESPNGYTTPGERPNFWAGEPMTREAYNNLPELD